MGWSDDIVTTYLDKDILLPAIGQGALGIECRSDDEELLELLKEVHNKDVEKCVTAERTFLAEMDGSCQVPIGGYATINSQQANRIYWTSMTPDGTERYEHTAIGESPTELGKEVSRVLKRTRRI